MRKTLLLALVLCSGLPLLAQVPGKQNKHTFTKTSPVLDNMKGVFETVVTNAIPSVKSLTPAHPGTQSGIIVSALGQESNAFGTSSGTRQYLWADPSLNTITLTHRVLAGSNTGFIAYDVSKDNGLSWFNNTGPIYQPNGDPKGNPFSVARFPQGVIYNPAANVSADSAFVVYFAPTRDNTNPTTAGGDWGGYGYGVCQLGGGPPNPTANTVNSTGSPYQKLIPDGMTITKQGTVYVLDENAPGAGLANNYMDGNLIQSTGIYNASKRDFDYTFKTVPVPTSINNSNTHDFAYEKISFADDGLTGYISSIAHTDYTLYPDSSFNIVVQKTTDGGQTWGPAHVIEFSDVDTFLANNGSKYTTAFDLDAVVDGAGNLHMSVDLGVFDPATGFSLNTVYGHYGVFDVFTTDGGVTYRGKLLYKPQTFRGSFGVSPSDATNPSLSEDNRAQASRTYTGGNQLFFTWFSSDSALGGAAGNIYPNMWSMGYDISTHMWTAPVNFTGGTAVDGKIIQGSVSYYVIEPSPGVYTIPCAFSGFQGADPTKTGAPVQLNYIDGAQFITADFNVPDDSHLLLTGVSEYKNNNLAISQNYPNPFSGTTTIDVTLKKASDLSIEVMNTLGQVISTQSMKSVSPGIHTFTINGSDLSSGLYIYTVKTGDSSVTRKMSVK
jgi:hypothetical protein